MRNRIRLFLGAVLSVFAVLSFSFPSSASKLSLLEEYDYERVRLVVEEYEIVEGEFRPGNEVKVKFVVRNISKDFPAKGTVLSMTSGQGIVLPTEGMSNQTVLGDIEADSTCEVTIPFRINESVVGITDVAINLYFNFMNITGEEVGNEAFICIPLKDLCELTLNEMELADDCYIKESTILSCEVENTGKVMLTEVELHVLIEGSEEAVFELDDIAVGVTHLYDHVVCMPEAGEQIISAYLTYEDEDGNAFIGETTEIDVRVLEEKVEGNDISQSADGDENQQNLIVNGVLVFIALLIIVVFRCRDRKRITSGKEIGYGKRG